jgi:hypothetical protein
MMCSQRRECAAVCGRDSTQHSQAMHGGWWGTVCPVYSVHSVQCTVSTVYSVQCTVPAMSSTQCPQCTVYTLYSVHCTAHAVYSVVSVPVGKARYRFGRNEGTVRPGSCSPRKMAHQMWNSFPIDFSEAITHDARYHTCVDLHRSINDIMKETSRVAKFVCKNSSLSS